MIVNELDGGRREVDIILQTLLIGYSSIRSSGKLLLAYPSDPDRVDNYRDAGPAIPFLGGEKAAAGPVIDTAGMCQLERRWGPPWAPGAAHVADEGVSLIERVIAETAGGNGGMVSRFTLSSKPVIALIRAGRSVSTPLISSWDDCD